MDEHFTLNPSTEMDGGVSMPGWPKTYSDDQQSAYAGVASLCKVLFICAVIWIIVTCVNNIPTFYKGWYNLVHGKTQFTNKEGLLYTGALANQLRDDTPYAQDSLAEQAAAAQEKVTNMTAGKSSFMSREGLISKPEDDLKKSFAQ